MVNGVGLIARASRARERMLASTAVLAVAVGSGGLARAEQQDFTIQPQAMGPALVEFAEQADIEVLYDDEDVADLTTGGVAGASSRDEALDRLLKGSGLRFNFEADDLIVVRPAEATAGSGRIRVNSNTHHFDNGDQLAQMSEARRQTRVTDAGGGASLDEGDFGEGAAMEVVVVTGTNIRGQGPVGSPLMTIDREEIDRAGFATTQQLIQSLPQNFGGGSNADVVSLPGDRAAGFNSTSGSSVNLRGLGSGSTLVLLNGRRLAPAGAIGDFVDISMIPLSAVERVEVLTDGASAIYGADAIAGVVNFVLRDDYDGAETILRLGTVTEGGAQEYRANQTFGKNWNSGNALLSYEFYRRDRLGAEDKDFSSEVTLPNDLLPDQESHSVLASISQALTDRITLRGHGIYSRRDSEKSVTTTVTGNLDSESEQYGGSLGAEIELWNDWILDLSGGYNKVSAFIDTTGDLPDQTDTDSDIWSLDATAGGSVFQLPGGSIRLAVGLGYREESFSNFDTDTDSFTAQDSRNIFGAFAEILIPVIGPENQFPGVERLELSVAGRFEDYSDFGSTTNPKVGVLWAPFEGLAIRGSYSASFNPPNLGDSGTARGVAIAANLPDPVSPSDLSVAIISTLNDANLGPEESTTWTAGLDYERPVGPGLFNISMTWFDIQFDDRIDVPSSNVFNILTNPTEFADIIVRSPDSSVVADIIAAAQSQSGFSNFSFGTWSMVGDEDVLLLTGLQNLARTDTTGLDFIIAYALDLSLGQLSFNLNGNYLFEIERAITSTSPIFDVVSTVFNPVDFRMRGSASWSRDGINTSVFVNYTDGYRDDRFDPEVSIESWTTVDLNLSYDTGDRLENSFLRNTKFSLSVFNLFDQDPPSIAIQSFSQVGFDSANADPLGRFIAFQVAKRW